MNSKHTPKFKALLALFLSISMLFSMVVTSFAALPQDVVDDDVIRYVSIGDSVTNGYGLDEYYFYDANGKRINSTGFRRYVPTSYPYRISEILSEALGMPVELDPMAIAGMRFNDLRLILDESFGGDTYMGDENGDGIRETVWRYNSAVDCWLDIYLSNPEDDKIDPNGTAAKYIKDYNYTKGSDLDPASRWEILNNEFTLSIEKADFISIDLGSNDFGTYLTDRLMDYVQGEAFDVSKADYQRFEIFFDEVSVKSLENMVLTMIQNAGYEEPLKSVVGDLVETLLYGLVSFCGNFDACMELLFDINPDAQVMIIDAYNMMSSVKIDGTAVFGEGINVSDIMNIFIDMANLYTRELSPYASKVLHVDIGADSYPDLVMDYFNDFSGWMNLEDDEVTEARTIMKLLLEEFLGDEWSAVEEQIITIDNMEDDISGTISLNIISAILENAQTSVEGVNLVKKAVDGVAQAESLIGNITSTYVDTAFLEGYLPDIVAKYDGTSLESIIRSNISSTVEDLLKDESLASMLPQEVTSSVISDMVYDVALAYGKSTSNEAKNAVIKAAVIDILELAQSCDEAYANFIYNIVSEYNDEANTTDKEKMVAAITTYLSADTSIEKPEAMAELAYTVYCIYDAVVVKGTLADANDVIAVLTALYGDRLLPEQINAIGACYSGNYTDEELVTAVSTLMALGGYADSIDMYKLYHQFPYTLSEIAQSNTIYLDSFLPYLAGKALDFDGIAARFFSDDDPLILTEPDREKYESDEAYNEAFEMFKHDSTLLTVYIRFLSLTGLFVHPNSTGHATFTEVISEYLDKFVPNVAAGDDVYELRTDIEYKVLAIGDEYIKNVEDCYAEKVAEALDSTVKYQSYPGWTVGETLTFAKNNPENISGYDLILLNVGAWNVGYIAKYLNSNGTAPIDLTDIDILDVSKDADGKNSIGERFEDMLSGDDMMLMAKAMMYGYADFANSIEPLVETLLDTGATVVIVGLDKLMSDNSIFALGENLTFKLDLLIEKLTSDFNGHMEVIADKYENCYFTDISGVNTGVSTPVVITPNGVGDMATMMGETLFDEYEHEEIAKRIICDTLGIHVPNADDEGTTEKIATLDECCYVTYSGCELCGVGSFTREVEHVWGMYLIGSDEATGKDILEAKWADDFTSATPILRCPACDVETLAEYYTSENITIKKYESCEEDGYWNYTVTFDIGGEEYVNVYSREVGPTGHKYVEPTWEWTKNEDGVYVNAEATFVCANDEEHVEKVSTEEFSVKVVTEPTCTGEGENEYTATVEFNDKEYSNTNPEYVVVDKIAHAYDKPVWAWSEDLSEATASFECISCDDVQVVEAEIESETTKSTCLEHGETVYTATVVFGDDKKEFTDSITVELELGDHDYVDDICSVCGEKDPDARPDETGDCVYVTEEELDADGVYTMTLGGEEVGEFEFIAVDGGWTISDDGEYLAIENGKLVYSENAFVWTFEDDMFSASETVVEEIKKGFWGGLFGGSDSTEIVETTTTYYLAVVEDELTAGEIGDAAEFSVKHHDDKHSYDEGVVTKPTCTDKGYTTYTCEKCGEECVYNEREKIEHNYVDGKCEDCGKLEDVEEPEEPEENCIYIEEVELEEDGSYILSIGGYEVGKYTVTAVDDGWTIFDEKDETYLAVLNGILVYTDEEFVWAYDEEECKFFYEDVKVVTTTNNFWGGLFGGSTSTETIVNVYYIVPEEDKLVVSEDDELAEVTFEVIVVEEGHDYVDGICENCGKCEDDTCVHFDAVELEENGEYVLIIGDEHLGFHTFENVDEDLWTIVNEDGDYVALEDGEIVYTSEEFVWTYDSEKSVFSVEIVTVATSGFWGGLFGGNTSTKVETYYLVAEDGNLAVSLKDKTATAEFLVEVEGEHEYGDLEDYYGLGRSFCENCGTVKFEIAE